MTAALNIGSVRLPLKSLLKSEIETLIQACKASSGRSSSIRPTSQVALSNACSYLVEGLYQSWSALNPNTPLALPTSPRAYHRTKMDTINHLSHKFVVDAIDELKRMRWAKVKVGYQHKGRNVLTRVRASGHLLDRFQAIGAPWQELKAPTKAVRLRDRASGSKKKYSLPLPKSSAVWAMEKNLRAINQYLAKQAICLHMSNARLLDLGKQLTTPLIFSHVALRRIFSRGSIQQGGRFYGAWWESIPSEFRPFLTINGMATGEIDFREIHPRMLYLLKGVPLPARTQDLYDDGWRDPHHQQYDVQIEPYRSRRKILKTVFNALLNDDEGRFRLDPKDYKTARDLSLNLTKIKKILFKMHPLLMDVYRSGIGLNLQFLDSQIAERVMLDLMNQDIPCLPVHDSFIVPRHQTSNLRQAMQTAFKDIMGTHPVLKDTEPFDTDFRLIFKGDQVDLQALHQLHQDSWHNKYVLSRHTAMQEQAARRAANTPPTM